MPQKCYLFYFNVFYLKHIKPFQDYVTLKRSYLFFFFVFPKLLHEHTNPIPGEERWPVIGQFSSIGSMGADKTKWLAAEFQRTLTTLGKSSLRSDPPMHLVRCSIFALWTLLSKVQGKVIWLKNIQKCATLERESTIFLCLCAKTWAKQKNIAGTSDGWMDTVKFYDFLTLFSYECSFVAAVFGYSWTKTIYIYKKYIRWHVLMFFKKEPNRMLFYSFILQWMMWGWV